MSTTATTKKRPASVATTRKMITRTTVSSTERVRDGTLRGSGAHSHVGLSENKHIRSGRCVPQPIAPQATVWPRPGRGNRSFPSLRSDRCRWKRSRSWPGPAVPSHRVAPRRVREGRAAPATKPVCKQHAPRPASARWKRSSWPFHDSGAADDAAVMLTGATARPAIVGGGPPGRRP
jgi:hypothetical protein